MLKRSSARLVIIVAVIMAAGLALGLPRVKDERQDAAFDLERFATAYRHIVLSYVDDVDSELLVDKAIEAMVDELDAFSVVMDEDRFEDLMVRSKQEFGGLGIVISIRDDGAIFVDTNQTSLDTLIDDVNTEWRKDPLRSLLIKADEDLRYEQVRQVTDKIAEGGASTMLLATEKAVSKDGGSSE